MGLALAALILLGAPAAQAQHKSDKLQKLEARLTALQIKGNSHAALPVAKQVYDQRRRELGAHHVETGFALTTLAGLYATTGDHIHSIRIYQDLLKQAEARRGVESPEAATALDQLVSGYWVAQRLADAEPLCRRSLALKKKLYGDDSMQYATQLQMYGGLLSGRSSFSAAEEAYRKARAILEKQDKDSTQLIGPLFGLGWIYLTTGQERRAREAFDRVLAIHEKSAAQMGDYAVTARAGLITGVASMYHYGGYPKLARPLVEQAEKLLRGEIARRDKLNPDDPQLSGLYGQLAGMLHRAGKLAEAEALFRRAMKIDEKQAKANPMVGVTWLSSLAMVLREADKPREALALLEQMRKVYAAQMGESAAAFMDALLADAHRELGDYGRAEALYRKMLAQMGRTYGKDSAMVAVYLESLAWVELAAGQPKVALATLERALAIAEPALQTILAVGTEQDHASYFQRIRHQLDLAVLINVRYAPRDRRAARAALTTALRRKGRILDAAANTVAVLRGKLGKDDQILLDELAAARGQLAKLILAGPGGQDPDAFAVVVAELESTVRRLEDQMRRKSAAYRAATETVELAAVQKAVPRGAALVEIVSYQAFDPRARGAKRTASQRRYAAYVLERKGEPILVELGDGAAIDQAAREFLEAVSDPDRDVVPLGKALYKHTFARLEPHLAGKQVFIAPDGALNLVPFGALTDDHGAFLVARYEMTYLTSGRDLLRLGPAARARQGAVIVADPAFDGDKAADADAGAATDRGRRSRDLRGLVWQQLPGTAEEAAALDKVLEGATLLEGKRATERAIKQVHGPRILHIATHGFFLPADDAEVGPAPAPGVAAALPSIQTGPENPLLRSGLALAGANKLSSDDEDGVLTALEAVGLDLTGTGLVVLSACETGVGKVTDGDGVHGLRRALVIAGARSLVMSLWQVDDAATRDLMTGLYRRLGKQGPSAALRSVQLELMASERYAHPYFWASFVPAGDHRRLEEN